MSTATNLTGNRVYRMSSHAPTRGQNDPTGYIARGLRNNAAPSGTSSPQQVNNSGLYGGVSATGGDGESDTRSGIAQGILNGQPQGVTGASDLEVPPPPTGVSEPLIITETGQMQLPFNYEFAQGALQKKQETDLGLLNLQQTRQQQLQEYLRNKYNANRDFRDVRLGTLNNHAARGVAFSSGYGQAVGRNSTNYNNLIQQLEEGNVRSENAYDSGRSMLQANFKDFLRQQALAQGVSLETVMGSLGFGK